MPGPVRHHDRPLAELVAELATDTTRGLSRPAATDRLSSLGPNELTARPPRPAWLRFLDQFRDLLVALLAVGAVLAGMFGDAKDAIAIVVVLIVNAVLGFVQEQRAAGELEALRSLLRLTARVRRDGVPSIVDAADLVPGDLVDVEAGDRIPADGRIVEAHAFEVDEAALTGESAPVTKTVSTGGMDAETPLAERSGSLFAQTQVTRGRARMLVVATGDETEIGRIATLVARTGPSVTPLQRRLDRLGKLLAAISGAIVVAYLVLAIAEGRGFTDTFVTAVALLVAAIPEGLPAVVTLTLALGTRRLAAGGAIVKRLRSVETLGSAAVICTDKTGTLTMNEMTVAAVATADATAEVHGRGYGSHGTVGPGIEPGVLHAIAEIAVLCSDAHLEGGDLVGDPTEGALVSFAAKVGVTSAVRDRHPRRSEVPFDAAHRIMVTVTDGPDHTRDVRLKGALEPVMERCVTWCAADGSVRMLTEQGRARVRQRAAGFAQAGMRVLALADRIDAGVDASLAVDGLRLVGVVGIVDPPRTEVAAAIASFHDAGVDVKMITGDHPSTASAIADQVGIVGDVVSGADLDDMDDAVLNGRVDTIGVFARAAPEHKLRIVDALRANGRVVAMTGDGVNDTPALRAADIGVAMGITGTEVAKEAADVVLATDDFTTIHHAVREARIIYDNIVKFVRFQLATNIGALATIFFAQALGMPTPFTPIQLLWINLIMDGPPALALSVDAAAPGVMRRAPRASDAQILDSARLGRLVAVGGAMAALALGALDMARGSWNTPVALTVTFTAFVLFQVVNALGVRNEHGSVFTRTTLENPALWAALAGVVALQIAVVEVAPLARIFGTTNLSGAQWLAVLAAAGVFLVAQQAITLIGHRRIDPRRG